MDFPEFDNDFIPFLQTINVLLVVGIMGLIFLFCLVCS